MLRQLSRRVGNERGQSQIAVLGTIVIVSLVALIATGSFSTASSAMAKSASPLVSAQALLRHAEVTAASIAKSNGGSYSKVGLVNLRKHGLIRFKPSSTAAWMSSASSTSDSYTLTVTTEPGGKTFTISRNSQGAISRS